MADPVAGAHLDQVGQRRVHGDKVHPERPLRQRPGARDLGIEQRRRHRSARDHPEAAGVRHRRDEVALRHPRHRPRHDRDLAAEESGAARHQLSQARVAGGGTGIGHARRATPAGDAAPADDDAPPSPVLHRAGAGRRPVLVLAASLSPRDRSWPLSDAARLLGAPIRSSTAAAHPRRRATPRDRRAPPRR